jgi:branched-chain amino acid transport system ATP-binding protein
MLRIDNIFKSFDGFMAVSGATLRVRPGEVVAVIGPNGAGKTTLFNLITGQLVPDKGAILFKGEKINGLAPHTICRRGISRSYQVVNIFKRLTVFDNVQIAVLAQRRMTADLLRPARRLAVEETHRILESVGLAAKAEMVSGTLSHGDQKVLEIAISLGTRPELLIMDEPTAGMSPEETAVTLALMNRLSGELGLTILFCEHDMGLVFSIARSIMVMQQGRTLIQGMPDEVHADPKVREAYLGEADRCFV